MRPTAGHAVGLAVLLLLAAGRGAATASSGRKAGVPWAAQQHLEGSPRWQARRVLAEPARGVGGVQPQHRREALDRAAGAKNCSWSPASEEVYWGGPVLTGGINVYLIFYGNWSETSCGPAVIQGLVNSLSTPLVRIIQPASRSSPTCYVKSLMKPWGEFAHQLQVKQKTQAHLQSLAQAP